MATATATVNRIWPTNVFALLAGADIAATRPGNAFAATESDRTPRREAGPVNKSAFVQQLVDLSYLDVSSPSLNSGDAEPPNSAAIQSAQGALVQLWLRGLVPSVIVPSAEGGVGISLLNGPRQAHFEFSNEGDFSLIMFEGNGAIEVLSDQPTLGNVTSAMQRARSYLAR